jgi:hypothetical protein
MPTLYDAVARELAAASAKTNMSTKDMKEEYEEN